MIMEKVVHIPKYVKPWYIYQLILSQLSWNEHSSGSDKIIWYMYQDFTYFGMYHFPQSFWQKTIFYLHIILEYVTTEGFSLQLRDSRVFLWAQFEIQRFLATNNGFEHILLLICQSPKIELFQTILKSCQTFKDLKKL